MLLSHHQVFGLPLQAGSFRFLSHQFRPPCEVGLVHQSRLLVVLIGDGRSLFLPPGLTARRPFSFHRLAS
jgi:hypothetical protein